MRSYFSQPHRIARPLFLVGGLTAIACSNLLGISEPSPRALAGASGVGLDAAGNAGEGETTGGAGSAGLAAQGGQAGQAGQDTQGGAGGDDTQGGAAGSPQCSESTTRCVGNEQQKCQNGAWVDDHGCAAYCLDTGCVSPPSCGLLGTRTCGDSVNCCRALEVPGGTFFRDYDGKQYPSKEYPATVSSFLMDRFEVSVGRLVSFVNAYPNIKLKQGDGKALRVAGDPGWQDRYPLPKDVEALMAQLNCTNGTWLDAKNGDLNLPANCVDFYVAYAFCIWDQGRLPTETEWNYAAAGGAEQREYPWSVNPNDGLDLDHAYYGPVYGLPIDIGMKPLGNGRWGHSDLSGNVNEWTLDFYTVVYPSTDCKDCVNSVAQPTRTTRGGGYAFYASAQKVGYRTSSQPDAVRSYTGFRCVHDFPISGSSQN